MEGDAVASEIAYIRKYFTSEQIQELIQQESSASTATLTPRAIYEKPFTFPTYRAAPSWDEPKGAKRLRERK